jgi:hypothetical protein
LHSAVSQICNLRGTEKSWRVLKVSRLAECNSAIQQIKNLRYICAAQKHTIQTNFLQPSYKFPSQSRQNEFVRRNAIQLI